MINKQLINLSSPASGGSGTGNQEEGLILHLDANDVDSYDGDGSEWVDITNHEYTPATNVSEHFNTVLYTGSASAQTISASTIGFQPDLVWLKNRDGSYSHRIFDTVRGANERLLPDSNASESTRSGIYSELSSFSDGFTLDPNNRGVSNSSGDEYVAWCFKAGGAPTATNSGGQTPTSGSKMVDGSAVTDNYPTADIYPIKQSVNTKLGFSVTEYTGAASGKTLPHGLDVPPEMYIIKTTDLASNWWVYTIEGGDFQYLKLNETDAGVGADQYYDRPTEGLIEQGQGLSTENVMYTFASKRGVSKVGSYIGGTTNEIYTGFEPAFLLVKRSNASGDDWHMFDTTRGGGAKFDEFLKSNTADAEGSSSNREVTFNRNGFKWSATTSNAVNTSGNTYIYYAVAKNTNETSLIPDTDLELHLDAASYSGSGSTWTADVGNDGTITGATYDQEIGDWFDFDGSGDVVTSAGNLSVPNRDFSVEFWVRPDSTSQQSIFEVEDTLGNRRISMVIESSKFRCYIYQAGTFSSSAFPTASSTFTAGKWHHITITFEQDVNAKIYIDGSLDVTSTTNVTGNRETTYGETNLGDGTWGDFNGGIGQYRFYSSVLTADEVMQNYNFTKSSYPNGYDGAITGATWYPDGYFDFSSSSNKVVIPNNKFYSNFSVSLWVRFDNVSPASGYAHNVFSKTTFYASSHTAFPFAILNDTSGTIKAALSYGDNYTWNVEATGAITANTWYHVVVTAEQGDKLKLYLTAENGTFNITPTSEATYTGTVIDGANLNYTIGNAALQYGGGSGKGFLDGRISKVKMYDKVLTASEASEQFNEGR